MVEIRINCPPENKYSNYYIEFLSTAIWLIEYINVQNMQATAKK